MGEAFISTNNALHEYTKEHTKIWGVFIYRSNTRFAPLFIHEYQNFLMTMHLKHCAFVANIAKARQKKCFINPIKTVAIK